MLISAQTWILTDQYGPKEALKILKDAGFDCADFSFFGPLADEITAPGGEEIARDLKNYAESIGMFYNQAHARFGFSKDAHDNYKRDIVPLMERTMEISSILGVDTLVIHPIHHIPYSENKEKLREINLEYYKILEPTAKKYGLRICLENMFQWDDVEKKIIPSVCGWDGGFIDYFDTLDSDTFTCCLDIGHCGVLGVPAADAIRILGHDRLGALHVHDNDNVADKHLGIGFGKIDWDSVAKALADIDYSGIFTLEADNSYTDLQKEFRPAMARYLYESAKAVVDKIEFYKNQAK